MKLIYLIIDGVADRVQDTPTSLEAANIPGLDSLARMSKAGLAYTIGKGVAPESDAAVLAILGYDPHKAYTGRGPLEALGVGIRLREGYEVAFRANFATVADDGVTLIDRRVGRDLSTEEARALAATLDGVDLGLYDSYARVVATIGHRAVVVIGSKSFKLSDNVSNTDPAYVRAGRLSVAVKSFEPKVTPCEPLDDTEEAARTAQLVNRFTKLAFKLLNEHPVNVERAKRGKLKANAVLMRDAGGRLPKVKPVSELHGLRFGAVVEMPVEKGIARLLGMDVYELPAPTGDRKHDYKLRLKATLELLERNDAVYVHLKGPDEPAHDGDFEGKVKAVEDIDEFYVQPLLENVDLGEVAVVVTADHATPYTVKSHTDDPVPLVVAARWVKPDGIDRFTERECAKGTLGVIPHGWLILPRALSVLREASKT